MDQITAKVDGGLFKWEDSPGLYHGCGVCGTCLNSPRAKKTCYGPHSEPCVRYHQTMFQRGASHKCDPCHRSHAMHEKRHKEIGEIILDIQALDGPSKSGSDDEEERSPKVRRLMKKPSTILLGTRGPANASDVELDGLQAPVRMSAKEKRELKQAAKIEKEHQKALQRQGRNGLVKIVPQNMLDEIGRAIHGPNPCFDSVKPGVTSLRLIEFVDLHRRLEDQLGKPKSPKRRCSSAKDEVVKSKLGLEYIREVIEALGVTNLDDGSKERKDLIEKLAEAIYQDIELLSRESKETLMRFTGYWKWASKRTYNEMISNNELVNWETGEKLSQIEEDDDEPGTPPPS